MTACRTSSSKLAPLWSKFSNKRIVPDNWISYQEPTRSEIFRGLDWPIKENVFALTFMTDLFLQWREFLLQKYSQGARIFDSTELLHQGIWNVSPN